MSVHLAICALVTAFKGLYSPLLICTLRMFFLHKLYLGPVHKDIHVLCFCGMCDSKVGHGGLKKGFLISR